jgi:hypothetical protein
MVNFWVVAPCSLVEVYRQFIGVYCFHRQDDNPLMEAVRTSDTSINLYQITQFNNPTDTHLLLTAVRISKLTSKFSLICYTFAVCSFTMTFCRLRYLKVYNKKLLLILKVGGRGINRFSSGSFRFTPGVKCNRSSHQKQNQPE